MSICTCGLAKSYHGPPTNLADHEYVAGLTGLPETRTAPTPAPDRREPRTVLLDYLRGIDDPEYTTWESLIDAVEQAAAGACGEPMAFCANDLGHSGAHWSPRVRPPYPEGGTPLGSVRAGVDSSSGVLPTPDTEERHLTPDLLAEIGGTLVHEEPIEVRRVLLADGSTILVVGPLAATPPQADRGLREAEAALDGVIAGLFAQGHSDYPVILRDQVRPFLRDTPPAGLDVERLARAMFIVTVDSPGLLSDVDMLNDPLRGNTRQAADAIAAEYARLRDG